MCREDSCIGRRCPTAVIKEASEAVDSARARSEVKEAKATKVRKAKEAKRALDPTNHWGVREAKSLFPRTCMINMVPTNLAMDKSRTSTMNCSCARHKDWANLNRKLNQRRRLGLKSREGTRRAWVCFHRIMRWRVCCRLGARVLNQSKCIIRWGRQWRRSQLKWLVQPQISWYL